MVIPVETYLVTAVESLEYELLKSSLARSSVVGLDAEWKPWSREDDGDEGTAKSSAALRSFPTVTLLQIACREATDPAGRGTRVFLVDLLALELAEFWGTLRDVFESPHVLKLGFRFKQDLIYLSSTFAAQGCHPGFDKVEPFMDITSVYYYLKTGCTGDGKRPPKQSESLATICKQVLGVVLSKELQCSDWSIRPLTDEQKLYAAADAYYLLEIFDVFQCSFNHQDESLADSLEVYSSRVSSGLKDLFKAPVVCDNVLGIKFGRASDIVKSSGYALPSVPLSSESTSTPSLESTLPLDISLSGIVRKYGERILLQESERKPRTSKRKGRRQPSASWKSKDHLAMVSDWQGPPPWDSAGGGDECPRFLCDVMVEGLAKYLRCVGIDAAIPSVKKPEPRQLIEQAHKEKRVILTRDAKLLKHQYLIGNQVYKLKSLIKNDQLLEVIETFQLKISEEQLMSRCSKCNGRFIQKPLSIEEAVAASKGFQVIPNCLFKRDLEFWQCMDCGQLYWEGTQYQNAVQRFTNVCKLTD
ncbi:unnamed protein product [Spirodela intermedia]|uniref:3'-5' exonuclease domain-containing protein n=1 Tax=Spirodela intermedia TaxID=51605 RepID=A0A7I8K5R7_SPIIN|nr:unnamed protein product [Spirodela intermedia]